MSAIETLDQLAAEQKPRTFDSYALGPFLIWASFQKKPLGRWTRKTLFVAGAMAIVYNWHKYRTLPDTVSKGAANVL
jgi:hypothetical protein